MEANKADAWLRGLDGKKRPPARVCLDLRKINRASKFIPMIRLPSYNDLKSKFENHYCSSFDIAAFYYAIPYPYSDSLLTTFWHKNTLYKFNRCVMGAQSSSYWATRTSMQAFGQQNFLEFCEYKKFEPGSQEMPYQKVEDFLLVYVDDANNRVSFILHREIEFKAIRSKIDYNAKRVHIFRPFIRYIK